LALTLIGGLIFGTFLTLIIIPLVYNFVVGETKTSEEPEKSPAARLKNLKLAFSTDKAKTRKP
jgi:hypothetical protein